MRAEDRAWRIAERAAEAWSSTGRSHEHFAVGVIAALCLTGCRDVEGPSPARLLVESSDEEIAAMLREIWGLFWISRPELGRMTGPFASWLDEDPLDKGFVRGAAAVARTAARQGLLDLAHSGALTEMDMIGIMYEHVRPDSGRAGRGEYYTPAPVCEAMAHMTLSLDKPVEPGMKICEPSAGTGGMLRAAAQWMRRNGHDPADCWWVANDISEVSVAGLAVNCHLWGLGPRVIIGVANSLSDPEWDKRAWQEQQEVIAHRDQQLRTARMLKVIRDMSALVEAAEVVNEAEKTMPALPPASPPVPAAFAAKPKQKAKTPVKPGSQLSLFD